MVQDLAWFTVLGTSSETVTGDVEPPCMGWFQLLLEGTEAGKNVSEELSPTTPFTSPPSTKSNPYILAVKYLLEEHNELMN